MPHPFSSQINWSHPITHHLTSSYITSPHHVITHLTSSHLIVITRFPWSRLTSCHLTLSYFTISHVMTSNPTLPHLILKLALKSIIASTKKLVILCIMGIIGNHKNSTFMSEHCHNKMERKYSRPLHAIASCHCITLHPPKPQGTQATSLRPVPSSSVFCTEFTSLRRKCLMAPTLFSLAASRMSWPRIPFKSKMWCRWSFANKWCIDIFEELRDSKSRIRRSMQEIEQMKNRNEITTQSFWRWKNSGQHAKLEHTQKET